MAKVFISFSRKDIACAKRLNEELQKTDLDFLIDWQRQRILSRLQNYERLLGV